MHLSFSIPSHLLILQIIQGSASDLVKLAMINIHRRMAQFQRQFRMAHTQAHYEQQVSPDALGDQWNNNSGSKMDHFVEQNTARFVMIYFINNECYLFSRLVMQIHDELVYEVPERQLHLIGRLIRYEPCIFIG
jgi:hypothetical protein